MPTDASTQSLEPQDIAAVESAHRTETVNQYLNCGWIITAIARSQSGPDDVSVVYHLGWPRHRGEPKTPDEIQSSRNRWADLLKPKPTAANTEDKTNDPA